ncbi:GTPase-associated system all-helical protein GASH [Rhizobacter sp. P5_C2]
MTDLATYVRIFDPKPTDDLVSKWSLAVDDLGKYYLKMLTIDAILAGAEEAAAATADGALPASLAVKVEEILCQHSPSFVRVGHELELQVCLMMGLRRHIRTASQAAASAPRARLLAWALWSALSDQACLPEPRLEDLRGALMAECESVVANGAEEARVRQRVPDFANSISESADHAALIKAFRPGTTSTVNALRANAALDREELDLLWWVLSDWSDILKRRLSTAPAQAAAVASGMEIGLRLRRLPASAHRHLTLRVVTVDDALTLAQLLAALGAEHAPIAAALSTLDRPTRFPRVFPMMLAMKTGNAGREPAPSRSLRDWSARSLLEAALLHVTFDASGN